MHDDKESQNQHIQFKCPVCAWDGGIDETAYDDMLGLDDVQIAVIMI